MSDQTETLTADQFLRIEALGQAVQMHGRFPTAADDDVVVKTSQAYADFLIHGGRQATEAAA